MFLSLKATSKIQNLDQYRETKMGLKALVDYSLIKEICGDKLEKTKK